MGRVTTGMIVVALVAGDMLVPASPSPAVAQTTMVEAGGQRCIAWTFVRQVAGVYDSSYIQFSNSCGQTVGFFWCHADVYRNTNPPACNAATGAFNMTTAPVGWSSRSSSSARAQQVVVIKECPTSYRPYAKTDGRFYCRR